MEFIEFIFSNHWIYIGFILLTLIVLHNIYTLINRFLRHLVMNKHGYPPAHCNADGDLTFKEETSEKTESNN